VLLFLVGSLLLGSAVLWLTRGFRHELLHPQDGARTLPAGVDTLHPLDLNQAGVRELTRLPGIGPALATRIVEYRKQHGPFRRVEDLEAVKGIGPAKLSRLSAYLKVDPEKKGE